jgi:hypothetical protein
MAGKSYPYLSHDLKLRLPGKNSQDKSSREDAHTTPDQPCPKCNGEGYIEVKVYPWDGCSYDERLCELCNPPKEKDDFDY